MKKLLAVVVFFLCSTLLFGEKGRKEARMTNLKVVNKTGNPIKVKVGGHIQEFDGYELAPHEAGWFHAEKSGIRQRIPGPLHFTMLGGLFKGKKYSSRHFFTQPAGSSWEMHIYSYSDTPKLLAIRRTYTPGVHLKAPWIWEKSGRFNWFGNPRVFTWQADKL